MTSPVDGIVEAVKGITNRVSVTPIGRGLNKVAQVLPKAPERPVPTPFGKIKLPELRIPEVHVVELDDRKREAFKSTIAIDIAQIAK